MEASPRQQSYQVQIDLTEEQVESETWRARGLCDDLQDIRGTVGLLLALCKGNRKIEPGQLSCVLKMLEEKLEGAKDLANGLRTLLESFTPTPDSPQGAKDNGAVELCLVPAASIHES